MINKKDIRRAERRKLRVRSHLTSRGLLHRVSVFKSAKHIYAQVIDDNAQVTVASCSSLAMKNAVSGDKKAVAHAIGLELAKRMKEKNLEVAFFDRGSFLYHGRLQALVEGLREGGIRI